MFTCSFQLSKELAYQEEEEIMMHEDAVHCLAFSRDSELLASGSAKGEVKVWKVRTGRCLRKFPSAHTAAINFLQFAKDGTQLM